MKRRALTKEDLVQENIFLISIYHYIENGEKRRFFLPRLVTGDQVLGEIRALQRCHNIFLFKFHFSNFKHTGQIFDECWLKHDDWRERITEYEKRVPYLFSSLASNEEVEWLYG
jgi:hypothetical protein